MTNEEADQLIYQINQLEEFIFDDYGDTVDQLGLEKTRALEEELEAMRSQYSAYLKYKLLTTNEFQCDKMTQG